MGLYGTSQVVPWCPVVQWDGLRGREWDCIGLYGTSQVVPWCPVVQWDGMDSRD